MGLMEPAFVVDTNVWVMAGKLLAQFQTDEEIDCAEGCLDWLGSFISGSSFLVVDLDYRILGEYRANIRPKSQADLWLNALERKPREKRLIEVAIEWDSDGYALVPPELAIPDKNDRKFVAVALAHQPTPSIVNATDSDWSQNKTMLSTGSIPVQELCEGMINLKLAETK